MPDTTPMNKILSFTIIITILSFPLFSFENKEGDVILENLEPPKVYWDIPEGSCGEACIWAITNSLKMKISQKKINALANSPGRGIHSGEILKVLKKLKIPFTEMSSTASDHRLFLEEKIIASIKTGNPVLLGVKIYPDENPEWACDHFILVVGFNETAQELIYNSNDERSRITLAKLLNRKEGYSILHRSKYVYAVKILK